MLNLRFNINLFCGGLSVIAAAYGVWLQQGFPGHALSTYVLLIGNAFLVLFSPLSIANYFKDATKYYSLFSAGVLILMAFLGYVVREINWPIAPFLSILGFGVFLLSLKDNLAKINAKFFISGMLIGLFFFSWVIATVWGRFSLSPVFAESISALPQSELTYVQDTLYHASFAQMLRMFDVASTGLDGLPYIFYHVGAHWLFGLLGAYLRISTLDCFNFGYPLIILPLFFQAFMNFSLDCSFQRNKKTELRPLFFVIFISIFIGLPKGLYSQGQLGISALVNESMVISMVLWFILLSILVNSKNDIEPNKLLIGIILPILVFAISRVKISTGFVTSCMLGYVFLRYRLWRNSVTFFAIFFCATAFVSAYLMSVETIPGARKMGEEGEFSWLHFYKMTHDFKPVDWFVWFFAWSYLVVIIELFSRGKLYGEFQFWEIVAVASVTGIFPGLVIAFSGGNSVYFAALQLFLSGGIVLGYCDLIWASFKNQLNLLPWKWVQSLTLVLLLIGVFSYLWMDVRESLRDLSKRNVLVRDALLGGKLNKESHFELFDSRVNGNQSKELALALKSNPMFQFIVSLRRLDTLTFDTRSSSAIFLNPSMQRPHSNLNCVAYTFLASSFAGVPSVYGIHRECSIGVYGEAYFPMAMQKKSTSISLGEASKQAREKGFSQLFYYQEKSGKFQLISLK